MENKKTVILSGISDRLAGINPLLKPAVDGIWTEYKLYVIIALGVTMLLGKFLPLSINFVILILIFLFGSILIEFM